MYLFLDWAGDPGTRFGEGSSEQLIFVVVLCVEYGDLKQSLSELRRALNLPQDYEFHYVETPRRVREAFFRMLAGVPFAAQALLVHKRQLAQSLARTRGRDVLGRFIAELMVRVPSDSMEGAILLVDGDKVAGALTRVIRVSISRETKAKRIKRGLKKVKGRPSHQEDGLQVADMLAGAIAGREKGEVDYLKNLSEKFTTGHFLTGHGFFCFCDLPPSWTGSHRDNSEASTRKVQEKSV